MRINIRGLFFPITIVVLVALDILLKTWAVNNLMHEPARILIPGILGLTYLENTGAAFGIGAGQAWGQLLFSVLKSVILIGIVWFYYKKIPARPEMWFVRVPLTLIAAGGIGNLIDRATLGFVRDMLRFEFINFPIFNLADVYVVVGCFVMIFVTLFVVKEI